MAAQLLNPSSLGYDALHGNMGRNKGVGAGDRSGGVEGAGKGLENQEGKGLEHQEGLKELGRV